MEQVLNISEFIENRVNDARNLTADAYNFPMLNLQHLAQDIVLAFQQGAKIAFLGNGGSAAESIHLAAEFTGKCVIDHEPLNAICLNESQSALTAIANDYGVAEMFSRQVRAQMSEGDILIVLSTSGQSPNILKAIDAAIGKKVRVILWMGKREFLNDSVEVWHVNSFATPRIQEIHLIWGHILAESVEYMWVSK